MKISRLLKTIFMIDFLAGLTIAIKEVFKEKKTINYPHEKGTVSPCIYCGLCEESCPVDAIVQGPNFEFSTETREELYYNKEKLLENGDRWESVLAANINADNSHR